MHSFKAAMRTFAICALTVAGISSAPAGGWIATPQAGAFPKHVASNRSAMRPVGIPGSWKIVLDSEFGGSRLPPDWHTGWFGPGVTNPVNPRELDCYSPANVTFPGDGTMHLAVTALTSSCGGRTRPFTGAMVSTDPWGSGAGGGFEYTYGVLQARVYIPAAGARIADWPAVWTDGRSWPADGEDDLVEGLRGMACFHFHDPLGRAGGCDGNLKPGWHTFASDWRPGSVTYYYDGTAVGVVSTGVTAAPMYVVLDNTVNFRWAQAATSAAMRVRYVRVWQHS